MSRRRIISRRGIALALTGVIASLGIEAAAEGAAASAGPITGTCATATILPCVATAGQTYGGFTVAGGDDERSVEAVLSQVVGPGADVTPVAQGFTPAVLAQGRRFDWSYRGTAQNVAYLTVKAGSGFAVIGVAGLKDGSVDVGALLGGRGLAHVDMWATHRSPTTPVVASALHGKDFLGDSRLARIENGTVPCLGVDTAQPARCAFTESSGSWLESGKGRFARTGQNISLDGKPGGDYVVAAKVGPDGSVPALAPAGFDSVGVSSADSLSGGAAVETLNSAANATFAQPLINYATREVCTSSYPHPDGALLNRWYTATKADGSTYQVYCYIGAGAGLNDINGAERDEYGRYYEAEAQYHVIWSNGYEVPAAKRPSTGGYPAKVIVNSAIVWRSVDNRVAIAN